MKIRSGFVSNSSSASFIMGMGVVMDMVHFKNWIKENGISDKSYNINNFSNLVNDWDVDINGNIASMESFNGDQIAIDIDGIAADSSLSAPEMAKQLLANNGDPVILYFYDSGDEPIWDEEQDDYNYDEVDLGWFEDEVAKLYRGLVNNKIPGIVKGQAAFGAGRDG